MSIYKKLLEVQKKQTTVIKNATNPHFKNQYATLDAIIETYAPILSDAGVVIYHTSDGSLLTTYAYDSESDTSITTVFPLSGSTPQQIGSSMTYAKRYNISQLLNIATDTDDDGNKASEKHVQKPKQKPLFEQDNYDAIALLVADGKPPTMEQVKGKYELDKYREEKVEALLCPPIEEPNSFNDLHSEIDGPFIQAP